MGDTVNISPRVSSPVVQNAILFLLIIHIIPSRQIYVAIDNPSLVLSVSCLTTSSYLWNELPATYNISLAETCEQLLLVHVSLVQILRRDRSYRSFQVLW